MRYLLVVLAFLLFCPILPAEGKHAPLPDAALQAKSLYLVNHTGKQSILDSAYNEFRKSGRFSIAETKESADLVAVFSQGGGGDQGATRMEVFVKGNEDAVYEVTKAVNSGEGLVWKHVVPDSSTKGCVDAFLDRLKQ